MSDNAQKQRPFWPTLVGLGTYFGVKYGVLGGDVDWKTSLILVAASLLLTFAILAYLDRN